MSTLPSDGIALHYVMDVAMRAYNHSNANALLAGLFKALTLAPTRMNAADMDTWCDSIAEAIRKEDKQPPRPRGAEGG